MAARPTVLVVDDVPSVCDLISMTLRYEGFAVHVAGSGDEALALAAQVRPDVAVLDVMLPDVNGFAVAERLVATGAPPAILFLTSRDDLQSKLRGLGVGMTTSPSRSRWTSWWRGSAACCGARWPSPPGLVPEPARGVRPVRGARPARGSGQVTPGCSVTTTL